MPKFFTAPDDQPLVLITRDVSGGVNNRQYGAIIKETQCTVLENVDIIVPGQSTKRKGKTLLKDISNSACTGSFGFMPRGGTNELLVIEGQKLQGCTSPSEAGSATFTAHKSDFTTGLQTTIIKATCSGTNGDVALVSNGTDKVFQMLQDHTMQDCLDDNYSCPKTPVLTFFNNMVWALKANLLYWSSALPATYVSNTSSGPFDRTTQNFNITVGVERALVGLRGMGLICFGQDAIYGINPSLTPSVTTDKPDKLLDIGCVAGKTAVQVGDDVYFLAPDGVRGVFRTQQDKLALQQSFPLSYAIKDQVDKLSWAYISKACAVYFDNKYLISVPVSSSTYNNEVWVYYPALQAWTVITGWNVGTWAKLQISGEERLYYGDSNDGSVFRAFSSFKDVATAIRYQEEGRNEDMGKPLQKKYGGEVKIKAAISGAYDINVFASVDYSGWIFLGKVALTGTFVTFPTTFPVSFPTQNEAVGSFHLDSLGEWNVIKLKLENASANTSDIKILERAIVTFLSEYMSE
jgi:hypothetical protein